MTKWTIDKVIEKFPWMEEIRGELLEISPCCGVELGQKHTTCDMGRCCKCGGQAWYCGCGSKSRDRWSGICMPNYYKHCVEQKLYCRDVLETFEGPWKGEYPLLEGNTMLTVMLDREFPKEKGRVVWHKKCEKNDLGWHYDVNKGANWAMCVSTDPTEGLWK